MGLPKPDGAAPRRGGGRPTRSAAALRDERVMDRAAVLFLDRGFDLASMDALAEAAGVSKATLYARFGDKRQLFVAVIRQEVGRWLAPLSAIVDEVMAGGSAVAVEATLLEIGRQMTQRSLDPRVVALGRVISMQAPLFPELAQLAHEEGWLRAVSAVARLLDRLTANGALCLSDPEIAADLLLNLVLGRSLRRAAYGIAIDEAAVEQRLQAAVKLFLHGAAARPQQSGDVS
ncbi:MAG: TetR/AcrR family transcriptional regulator [Janthinobacterium lividum]